MRSNSETDTRRSDLPVRLRYWWCFISAFSIVDLADGAEDRVYGELTFS
jgi:hypothetical protein